MNASAGMYYGTKSLPRVLASAPQRNLQDGRGAAHGECRSSLNEVKFGCFLPVNVRISGNEFKRPPSCFPQHPQCLLRSEMPVRRADYPNSTFLHSTMALARITHIANASQLSKILKASPKKLSVRLCYRQRCEALALNYHCGTV